MDFVIIANAWGAGADNPTSKHRIAIELARRGHRILWLSGAGMRRPSLGSGRDRGRMVRRVIDGLRKPSPAEGCPGVHHVSPLLVPLPAKRLVRRLNGALYAFFGRWWAWRLGLKKPILINYVPTLGYALKHWPWRRVYHCVDLWSAFDMYDSAMMSDMDTRCCRYADVVVASSNDLLERCRKENANSHLVMHGVDYEHFRESVGREEAPHHSISVRQKAQKRAAFGEELTTPPAPERPRGRAGDNTDGTDGGVDGIQLTNNDLRLTPPADLPEGPIVGFFGLLSEWFDQELILELSEAIGENATLVLIGTADVDVSRLEGIPNILMLGPKPFSALPKYIAHFTVGIIPFVVNELTRAVNPIKLREMMAAGCRVVSTALPEVAKYAGEESAAGVVHVVRSQGEFVMAVTKCLATPQTLDQRRSLSDQMSIETWGHKVDEILAVMGES